MRWPRHLAPGAVEARRAGCLCSAVRNAYGRGHGDEKNPTYDVADTCTFHARDGQPARLNGAIP